MTRRRRHSPSAPVVPLLALLTLAAAPALATVEPDPQALGEVRGDTLYVTLDKVRAAAELSR